MPLTLYSKEACPLCQDAEQRIDRILPDFNVAVIDIVGNRELEDIYIFRIPVLANDHIVLAEGRITDPDLYRIRRALLDQVRAGRKDATE